MSPSPPPPTPKHTHWNTWAPYAGPPGQSYTQGRAHASRSHAHIPPRGRADPHTRGSQPRTPSTRENTPHPPLVAANHRGTSRDPPRAPDARTSAHTGPSGARPGLPGALLHTPAVSPHIPAAAGSPAQRESPGRAPAPPPPPGRPRRTGCAPRGGPGSTTWSKFLRFLILGGVRWAGVGGRETAAREAPRVLAPAVLRAALRAAAGPSRRPGRELEAVTRSTPLPGPKPRGAHLPPPSPQRPAPCRKAKALELGAGAAARAAEGGEGVSCVSGR